MAVFKGSYYWQRMPSACLTPITGSDRYAWCRSMACRGIFFGLANETESLRFARYNHINMLSQYSTMTLCLCLYASNEINIRNNNIDLNVIGEHVGFPFWSWFYCVKFNNFRPKEGPMDPCCQLPRGCQLMLSTHYQPVTIQKSILQSY